jgi:hypothetical protein
MSSQRRILSSRANGARSQGPVTPEGKARSSRNATAHGLLSDLVVLDGESVEGFDALYDAFVEKFDPADDVEEALIEEIAASYWRVRRAWATETRVIDIESRKRPDRNPVNAFAALLMNPDSAHQLELIHRYETRIHGMYRRALNNLLRLRRECPGARPGREGPTAAPDPAPDASQPDPEPSASPEPPQTEPFTPAPAAQILEFPNEPSPISGHFSTALAPEPGAAPANPSASPPGERPDSSLAPVPNRCDRFNYLLPA